MNLQKVEARFSRHEDGLARSTPGVCAQTKSRTRGHVFCCMLALKLNAAPWSAAALEKFWHHRHFNPHALTLPDALAALSSLCLLHYR